MKNYVNQKNCCALCKHRVHEFEAMPYEGKDYCCVEMSKEGKAHFEEHGGVYVTNYKNEKYYEINKYGCCDLFQDEKVDIVPQDMFYYPEMELKEFLRYCESHSETERALFSKAHVAQIYYLNNQPQEASDIFTGIKSFYSCDFREIVEQIRKKL